MPDASYNRQRADEAKIIETKCPGYVVIYGVYSRRFQAFGTSDGVPLEAESASELLTKIQAEERMSPIPAIRTGPPTRPYAT